MRPLTLRMLSGPLCALSSRFIERGTFTTYITDQLSPLLRSGPLASSVLPLCAVRTGRAAEKGRHD